MQYPLELILTRQWASHLAFPVWLYDQKGNLIFFNEHAEKLLGLHAAQAHQINIMNIADLLHTTSLDGSKITADSLPIVVALREGHPAYAKMHIRSLDGISRRIEATSFPIISQGARHVGAVTIFWEI